MERGEYGAVNVYKRLLDQARPYWRSIGGILLPNLLATPLSLLSRTGCGAASKVSARWSPKEGPDGR